MKSLDLLMFQLNSMSGPQNNEERILETMNEHFDIAIFPELFYSGYLRRDAISQYVLKTSFLDDLKKLVGDRMLIFGAPVMDKFLYNSAVVIHEGCVEIYHKMHLPNFGPFEELRYFSRGRTPLLINFRGMKINVQICYDLFFDDAFMKGSDVVVNISASPFTSRPYFEMIFPGRALENQAFLIYVNTAGLQRNQVFWGGSRVIDPDGNEVLKMKYFEESIGNVSINTGSIKTSRRKRRVLDEVMNEYKE